MAEYPADYLRTEQSGLYCTSAARRAFSALGTRGSCASAGSGDSHRNKNERLPPLVFEKAGFRWRKRLGEPLRVDAVTHCFRNRLGESKNPQTTPSKLRNVGYKYPFPDLLTFHDAPTPIEQRLFVMYLEHRMRTFQGTFHANPDYALWYGWSEMRRDLSEIKAMADDLRGNDPRR